MKINGVASYQVVEEIADIILSIELLEEDKQTYNLTPATTLFVSYDLQGNFKNTSICDEGLTLDLCLTDDEMKQLMDYIQENNLKEELMKQIA